MVQMQDESKINAGSSGKMVHSDTSDEKKTWIERATDEIEASSDEEAKEIWRKFLEADKLKTNITQEHVDSLMHLVRYSKVSPKHRKIFDKMLRVLNNRVERSVSDNFGSMIRYLREKRGYTLKEMEDLTGVSASYIHRIEKGERKAPTIKVIEKFAEALDCDFYELLSLANSSKKSKGKELPSVEQLILSNDFSVNGYKATKAIKGQLVDLINAIHRADWSESKRDKEMMKIFEQISQYKELLEKRPEKN